MFCHNCWTVRVGVRARVRVRVRVRVGGVVLGLRLGDIRQRHVTTQQPNNVTPHDSVWCGTVSVHVGWFRIAWVSSDGVESIQTGLGDRRSSELTWGTKGVKGEYNRSTRGQI